MARKLNLMILVFLFIFLSVMAETQYTWHSTIFEFQEMMKKDLEILRKLQKDLENEKKTLSKFKSNLESGYKSLTSENEEKTPKTSLNRLNDKVLTFEKTFKFIDLEEKLKNFPNWTDRNAVLKNLYTMQKIHKLKTDDLADGKIFGFISKHNMTANDCADIGDVASYEKENVDICLEWYNKTLQLILKGAPCRFIERAVRDGIQTEQDLKQYKILCREGKETLPIHQNRYQCHMWTNHGNPWLLLQPFKLEVLSKEPDIVRIYDVISDVEIEMLLGYCKEHFGSAKTIGDSRNNVQTVINSRRVAHNCWLTDGNNLVRRITGRIGHLTGLSMTNAEFLQIARYEIGGHYDPHHDYHSVNQDELTYLNRKATFMFYLSDVERGGSTVFLRPGIAVSPIKGSAVYWHNMENSGTVDTKTKHCACHVLVGNKIVANKWIGETQLDICKKAGVPRII